MASANVKNKHTGPLNIGGVDIGPGKTAKIENWDSVKNSNAIKVWLDQGIIETSKSSTTDEPSQAKTAATGLPGMDTPEQIEAAAKQVIIDRLKADHGIEKTQRTSLENLQKALDEAQADAG